MHQQEVFSWGIGETGELGRDVCPMKNPPQGDEEPGYDFVGIFRDHITPGGMFKASADGRGSGARMDNVKVSVPGPGMGAEGGKRRSVRRSSGGLDKGVGVWCFLMVIGAGPFRP